MQINAVLCVQVRMTLIRDRRSIRKKSSHMLAEWTMAVVKHSLSPVFGQTFTAEISMSEFKLIRVKVTTFDRFLRRMQIILNFLRFTQVGTPYQSLR